MLMSVRSRDGSATFGSKPHLNLEREKFISIVSVHGRRRVSPKLTDEMLYLVMSDPHTAMVMVAMGLCAWLPWKNIDLIPKGCGHILGSLPIVMIIRLPRVASGCR